jgi:hypothetical protein
MVCPAAIDLAVVVGHSGCFAVIAFSMTDALAVIGLSGGCFAAIVVGPPSGRCFVADCVMVAPHADALSHWESLLLPWRMLSRWNPWRMLCRLWFFGPLSGTSAVESVLALFLADTWPSWSSLADALSPLLLDTSLSSLVGCFATV